MAKAETDIQGATAPEIENAPAPVHGIYIAEGTGKTAQNEGATSKEVHNVSRSPTSRANVSRESNLSPFVQNP